MSNVIVFALVSVFFWFSSVLDVHSANNQQAEDIFKGLSESLIYISPALAIGMTMGAKDGTGALQLFESVVVSMGIMTTLKYTVREKRPNGDPYSFPSGHEAITITSAEFMRKRYGWRYGLPVYLVAGFVGYERIKNKEHYIWDVAAGAAISFVTTYLFTKPYEGWNILPVVEGKTYGIRLGRAF